MLILGGPPRWIWCNLGSYGARRRWRRESQRTSSASRWDSTPSLTFSGPSGVKISHKKLSITQVIVEEISAEAFLFPNTHKCAKERLWFWFGFGRRNQIPRKKVLEVGIFCVFLLNHTFNLAIFISKSCNLHASRFSYNFWFLDPVCTGTVFLIPLCWNIFSQLK